MALKPNYGQQRADRNRAKQEKKDRKLREQQEQTALRKATKKPGADAAEQKD
ncbi:hypothetical protein ACFPL7_17740 [Dongia soli]|uniref:Small EDRK-rich factor-like N-terminal domain-containing protein n=1 Tax=Dongia soli TaxID=600628 RepID=A0ABU5E723_9PROT|nr:hypothetical protein [Dongia soli]MDY0881435.1 hypothetical protein [Dongia soli]